VLLLDHCACIGGAQISLHELHDALVSRGVRVALCAPGQGSRFPVRIRGRRHARMRMAFNALCMPAVFLRHGRPAVYCNSLRDRLICALIPQRYVITHIRDYPTVSSSWVLRWFPSRSYVVSSAFMADRVRRVVGDATVPVHHVPNIVHLDDGEWDAPRDGGEFRFLMVANLVRWKGHELALDAFARLRATCGNVRLDVWGADPLSENREYSSALRLRMASEPGLTHVKGRRITPTDYCRYHCLVHPAMNEPFGRVIVEAMGCGVPVVAHATGGPAEIVRAFKGGILFEREDSESLCHAMRSMILTRERHLAGLRASRGKLRATFSAHQSMEALLPVLGLPTRVSVPMLSAAPRTPADPLAVTA